MRLTTIIIGLFLTFSVNASGGHHSEDGEKGDTGPKGNTGAQGANGKDGKNGIDGKDGLNGKDGPQGKTSVANTTNYGVASAIAAAQHSFSYETHAFQGSVAIGAFDSQTAFSFGLAKRFNKTLITGNVSSEEGKYGAGIGVNFRF